MSFVKDNAENLRKEVINDWEDFVLSPIDLSSLRDKNLLSYVKKQDDFYFTTIIIRPYMLYIGGLNADMLYDVIKRDIISFSEKFKSVSEKFSAEFVGVIELEVIKSPIINDNNSLTIRYKTDTILDISTEISKQSAGIYKELRKIDLEKMVIDEQQLEYENVRILVLHFHGLVWIDNGSKNRGSFKSKAAYKEALKNIFSGNRQCSLKELRKQEIITGYDGKKDKLRILLERNVKKISGYSTKFWLNYSYDKQGDDEYKQTKIGDLYEDSVYEHSNLYLFMDKLYEYLYNNNLIRVDMYNKAKSYKSFMEWFSLHGKTTLKGDGFPFTKRQLDDLFMYNSDKAKEIDLVRLIEYIRRNLYSWWQKSQKFISVKNRTTYKKWADGKVVHYVKKWRKKLYSDWEINNALRIVEVLSAENRRVITSGPNDLTCAVINEYIEQVSDIERKRKLIDILEKMYGKRRFSV